MVNLTYQQVRQRLGKIVGRLFTDTFARTFEEASQHVTDENVATEIVARQLEDVRRVIEAIFKVSSTRKLNKIYQETDVGTIYALYMLYHYATQLLVRENQNDLLSVPDGDKEFFITMLIYYVTDRLG